MGNPLFYRSDALTSAASPLLPSAQHFTCTSPVRSPLTPRRPHRSSQDARPSPREASGTSTTQARVDNTGQYQRPLVSLGAGRPSHLTVKIGPVPQHLRRPSRPQPLDFSTSSSSGSPSPTEDDQFLPSSALAITPSLLPRQQDDDRLGTFSAINIILGKTIGVGVYSVPSSIFSDVGSVGMTLVLWVLGSFISFCGLAVYLDLGSALPRSGGERVYLERIFRRPRMLATCMFMTYVVLLGFSTPNCVVLGQYTVYALGLQPTTWLIRTIAVITITVACIMHARFPRFGIIAINVLGVAKMVILAFVVLSGVVVGLSSKPSAFQDEATAFEDVGSLRTIAQRNFSNIWANSSSSPYDYSTALLKILYCFRGYNTANTVLSSVRRPIPTLKFAAPLALGIVSASYLLANIAYFCAVDKEDFRQAGVILAGKFLRNLFGETVGERVLPWLVIISAFGNVAATSFAQARVNQELGKDGLLPYSEFWAGRTTTPSSHYPINTYSLHHKASRQPQMMSTTSTSSLGPSLFLHFLISTLVILLPPPGQIYTFLIEIGGYPVSIISVAVSGGLLYLYLNNPPPSSTSTIANGRRQENRETWTSPLPAPKWCIVLFFLSNLLVCILPWIPPRDSSNNSTTGVAKARFPYYAYPATGLGILVLGAVYWVYWRWVKDVLFPPKKIMLGFGNDDRDVGMALGKLGIGEEPLFEVGEDEEGEEAAVGDELLGGTF